MLGHKKSLQISKLRIDETMTVQKHCCTKKPRELDARVMSDPPLSKKKLELSSIWPSYVTNVPK